MENALLWSVSVLCIVIGLAGTVLPVLPGALLMFAGLWLAAWIENYAFVGTGTLILLGVLAALTYAVDFFASLIGAKRFGASRHAMTGSVIGAFIGLFLGLPGILLGPFVGAVTGELYAQRDVYKAARSGFGATLGLALGAAVKLALVFSMLGVFAIARFFIPG